MPKGVSKLQLLIDLKNKLKVGLDGAKKQVDKATGGMQKRLDAFKVTAIRNFAEIKNEIPALGSAIRMLQNPLVLAAGAFMLVGRKAREAIAEGERFSAEFRQLNMLNLDKSIRDMGTLKGMIRATAYEKGFDPTKSITAFFDVQSTTGKYGRAVDAIVSKQGEFARLMQADFNNWISGTAKAMANYGFGAEKLDEFNKAAFATVQTGVTTFDELAKVQSVYAGAAAAAKQNFASANKLFSIFTVKVKSVDEAATLTKSLFNDLTKKETIAAFKKIGIDVYDANHQFKQADRLLLELQKKFKELGTTDQKLIDLKNQFTGSEGLISFVQAATDKTNQLQNTINTFDTTEFALPKALEIAKNDINYINEQLENRTKVLISKIGEDLLPVKKLFLEITSGGLEGTKILFSGFKKRAEQYQNEAGRTMLEDFPSLANPTGLSESEFNDLMKKTNESIEYYRRVAEQFIKYRNPSEISPIDSYLYRFGAAGQKFYKYQYASGAAQTLMELQKQARESRAKMTGDFTGVPKDNNSTETKTPVATTNAETIKRGSQTKSVTINIDSFIKGFNPTHQSVNNMNKDEIERWMTEMFMRVVRSAETTVG